MAVSIAAVGSGPGSSSTRDFFSIAGRAYIAYPFTVTFDASYPTNGELIDTATSTNSPWSVLRTVDRIVALPIRGPGGAGGLTANNIINAAADLTNKKLILFDGAAEVANTTSAALIVIPCIAYGFQ